MVPEKVRVIPYPIDPACADCVSSRRSSTPSSSRTWSTQSTATRVWTSSSSRVRASAGPSQWLFCLSRGRDDLADRELPAQLVVPGRALLPQVRVSPTFGHPVPRPSADDLPLHSIPAWLSAAPSPRACRPRSTSQARDDAMPTEPRSTTPSRPSRRRWLARASNAPSSFLPLASPPLSLQPAVSVALLACRPPCPPLDHIPLPFPMRSLVFPCGRAMLSLCKQSNLVDIRPPLKSHRLQQLW